jgi:hypothetical protein
MGYTHATRRAEQRGIKKQKIHARSISQYNKPARERERIKEKRKIFYVHARLLTTFLYAFRCIHRKRRKSMVGDRADVGLHKQLNV